MKIRDLTRLLGWRPATRLYGTTVQTFQLATDGEVRYAQWEHPAERPKVIRQEAVDEIRRFVRPGDVAIDIGAHTGDSTLPIALAAGPSGCVLALEPNPYVFPVLEQNAGLNPDKSQDSAPELRRDGRIRPNRRSSTRTRATATAVATRASADGGTAMPSPSRCGDESGSSTWKTPGPIWRPASADTSRSTPRVTT